MTVRASKGRKTSVALIIALISSVIIAAALTNKFSQSDFGVNLDSKNKLVPTQTTPPTYLTSINETSSLNATNPNYTYSPASPDTAPTSLRPSNLTVDNSLEPSQFLSLFLESVGSGGMAESDAALSQPSLLPISLYTTDFTTYAYGGYSVQNSDSTNFCFLFPDNTNQGQVAGSDAITLNTYAIQEIDFEAAFITPKIGAFGFDEMAIFAASNTSTYKGTEFGIRMDLSDGCICGYVQEPNGDDGEVNFQILNLTANDGMMHSYTMTVQSSQVSFFIDGENHGYLYFSSSDDYNNLTFSLCAVVHRFSDNWDSNGDNMTAGNFTLYGP